MYEPNNATTDKRCKGNFSLNLDFSLTVLKVSGVVGEETREP